MIIKLEFKLCFKDFFSFCLTYLYSTMDPRRHKFIYVNSSEEVIMRLTDTWKNRLYFLLCFLNWRSYLFLFSLYFIWAMISSRRTHHNVLVNNQVDMAFSMIFLLLFSSIKAFLFCDDRFTLLVNCDGELRITFPSEMHVFDFWSVKL